MLSRGSNKAKYQGNYSLIYVSMKIVNMLRFDRFRDPEISFLGRFKTLQDPSKTAPRHFNPPQGSTRLLDASRHIQDIPRRLQHGSRMIQDAFETLQDASKTPRRRLQERPRLQTARKTNGFSTCSVSGQIAFKRAPRRFETPPRRS